MDWWKLITVVAITFIGLLGLVVLLYKPVRRRYRRWETEEALKRFKLQREQLEAKFFDLASSQGKPRGLRWLQCDWQDEVTFARSVDDGLLTAFAAVNISFEAIEGGDMEEVEAVGTVRDAAAVFHYQYGRWGTGGRALFNMNPHDAIRRLQGQFVPVSEQTTVTSGR